MRGLTPLAKITLSRRVLAAAIGSSLLLAVPLMHGASNDLVLASRVISWQSGISTQLVVQLNNAGGKPVPAFLKFQAPLSLTNHQTLQASDVRLEDYFGDASYDALLPSATFLTNAAVQALIFAAEHFLPSDKLHQVPTSTNQFADWAYDSQSNTLKVLVGFWKPISAGTITNDLASLGLAGVPYGANNSWALLIPVQPLTNFVQTLTNLAALFSVKVIEQGPLPFLPLNDQGRKAANTDAAQGFAFAASSSVGPTNPTYKKVSGDAVRIAICDDGIWEGHDDFHSIAQGGAATGSRIYRTWPYKTNWHATHVASIAAGNGFNSQKNFAPPFDLRGHAPRAFIGNYTNFGGNADLYYGALKTDDSHISNHSYVQSYTVYDQIAVSVDEIVRGAAMDSSLHPIPARPAVWAAGNNGPSVEPGYEEAPGKGEQGYYSVFTSAKNTISVGSIDTETGRRSFFSSLGPTFDGRIKPDVVAPGNHSSTTGDSIIAADFVELVPGGQGYDGARGTSMAAPVVSGILALMMQQYKNDCPSCSELPPAMYKAILIHTAQDLVKPGAAPEDNGSPNPDTGAPTIYHAGPDFATGYGLVNAEAARAKIAQSTHWGQGVIPASGSSQTWCIDVPAGATDVKVVVVWDDKAGAPYPDPETHAKLVNDLDLVLKAPDATAHLPWTLAPLPLTANPGSGGKDPISPADVKPAIQTAADHLNNVEMVTVPLPANGTWQATITGFLLPFPYSQPYSIVSSHPISHFCISKELTSGKPFQPNASTQHLKENICRVFPKICDPHFIGVRRLHIVRGHLGFPTACPVSIEEICRYGAHCAGCGEGPAWQLCAALQMTVYGLPRYADLIVFNDRGEILDRDSAGRETLTLNVPEHRVGDRQFVLIMPESGRRLREELNLKFEFQPTGKLKGAQ